MVGCDLLDLKCIFVSELVGSVTLAVVLAAMLFFIFASRVKIGFRTTIVISIPILLLFGLAIGSFSALYGFLTLFIGVIIAVIFQKMVGNK
ncbi:hypothetical protein LCGC14_0466060 [marine sediment metagenome]|uniref:Uncharacterized protein n=1 Tax=marine sediment metagenome TaxID=412755 RepID=A0A0F9SWN7_9ZZZZ